MVMMRRGAVGTRLGRVVVVVRSGLGVGSRLGRHWRSVGCPGSGGLPGVLSANMAFDGGKGFCFLVS